MKILTYDEVDHDQVFKLHLSAFGYPLTEERVRIKVERDFRVSKHFGFYAVKGEKVVGQVIAMKIPTRTREGVEKVLGVAEVAVVADERRKGIASELMWRVEEMAVEEGMRFSWLITAAHLVAHGMYNKLGYYEMISFIRGFHKIPKKQVKPKGIKFRNYRKSDSETLAGLHKDYLKGSLGFTERQHDLLELLLALKVLSKNDIRVAMNGGEVVGYTVFQKRQGIPSFMEVVARKASDFNSIVRTIESDHKGSLASASSLVQKRQRDRFVRLGYQTDPASWYVLMAKPLVKGISKIELEKMYGFDDGSFTFMSLDGF